MSLEEKKFKVLTGEDINVSYLAKVFEIDKEVYEPKYVGCLENMEKRYKAEKRTFVCIEDKESGELAGYINFFPVKDEVWKGITKTDVKIRDDEIEPNDLVKFDKKYSDKDVEEGKGYNLFIISVAIREKYRKDKDAVITLTEGFREYLCKLNDEGYKIHALAGTAVSDDGMKFMRERFFRLVREVEDIPEDGKVPEEPDRVFVLDGEFLEYFLDGRDFRYKKEYKNDLYMIIPFSCNKVDFTERMKEYKGKQPDGDSEDCIMTRKLLTCLNEDLKYECKPEMTAGIKHYWLGSCDFIFSFDEYPSERCTTTFFHGEEKAHLIMMADDKNNLFNLLIFIPNSRFSPSNAGDQISQSFLPVRHLEGSIMKEDLQGLYGPCENTKENKRNKQNPDLIPSQIPYYDLCRLMNRIYGLIPCGIGKSLVCASDRPGDEDLGCILAGETYKSAHQDFRIQNRIFDLEGQYDKAVYDYYTVYMSERTVVFVEDADEGESLFEEREEEKDNPALKIERLEDRIEEVTTYTFIMEIVTFRNTALHKISEKVSAAILQDGDVSYKYLQTLYRDFAETDKYANKRNFKYYGTQKEAEAILNVFRTEELEQDYKEKQGFLESYIELASANRSKVTSTIVGLAATLVSLFSMKDTISKVIIPLAEDNGVPLNVDDGFFNQLMIAVFLFYLLIILFRYLQGMKQREENLIRTYREKYEFLNESRRGREEEGKVNDDETR